MYRIIGADGKEYGPVSAEHLGRWIAEGRANSKTQLAVEGSAEWKPLDSFPEFAPLFTPESLPRQDAPRPTGTSPTLPARTTNGFAVAGFVLGILSLCCLCCYGLPFNLFGLAFSLVGLAQIRNNPQLYQGKSLAMAGLVMCSLSILCGGAFLLLPGAAHDWRELPRHLHGHRL